LPINEYLNEPQSERNMWGIYLITKREWHFDRAGVRVRCIAQGLQDGGRVKCKFRQLIGRADGDHYRREFVSSACRRPANSQFLQFVIVCANSKLHVMLIKRWALIAFIHMLS